MLRRYFSASLFLFLLGCGNESVEHPYQVEFSAPEYLIQHADYLKEELIQIGDHRVWDYITPNRGFGNIILIEGYCSANFMRELADEMQATAPIMGIRAMYMYGQLLDPEQEARDYHVSGCGYQLRGGESGYIAPNTFVSGSQDVTIAVLPSTCFKRAEYQPAI